MGTGQLLNTVLGDMVHGHVLDEQERKILVHKRYVGKRIVNDIEFEEFIPGSFLYFNKLQLKKLLHCKEGNLKPGRGQKRGMSPEKWKAVNSKKHRNSGQHYVSKMGQVIHAMVFKKYECKCKFTECSKLSEEELELSFQKFWEIGDYNLQNAFLLQQIISDNKKVTRVQNPDKTSKPRLKSRNNFIVGKKVCKAWFPLLT